MASVLVQDFWQIYFIVTQKDGVEGVEQQSLGSSWGIVSGDENEAGDAAIVSRAHANFSTALLSPIYRSALHLAAVFVAHVVTAQLFKVLGPVSGGSFGSCDSRLSAAAATSTLSAVVYRTSTAVRD